MTGPEHYRAAERLLSEASHEGVTGRPVTKQGLPMPPEVHAALIARAQVHAQLALTAAHAMSRPLVDEPNSSGFSGEEWDDWADVVSPNSQHPTTQKEI